MTPQQRQIIATMRDAGGWITGRAIRDSLCTRAGVKSIHVQVSKLRAELGDRLELESEHGPAGRGYRLIRCAA